VKPPDEVMADHRTHRQAAPATRVVRARCGAASALDQEYTAPARGRGEGLVRERSIEGVELRLAA